MTNKELAVRLASDIFGAPKRPVERIVFVNGDRDLGGFSEGPLADHIENCLDAVCRSVLGALPESLLDKLQMIDTDLASTVTYLNQNQEYANAMKVQQALVVLDELDIEEGGDIPWPLTLR